jgi:pimeloyl-ACP methyl ester carboxylesterase
MPIFGETPLLTQASAAVDARADFVAELVQAMGLDRPILAGHSMGGAVVACAAARHPDMFRGLALLASVGARPHRSLKSMMLSRHLLSTVLQVPPIQRLIAPRMMREFERTGFKGWSHPQLVHVMHCIAALDFVAHTRAIRQLAVPTLVAWTEDDRFVEPAVSEDLAWRCPDGPRLGFRQGGHNLQKSQALELADAFEAWIPKLCK